MDLQRSSTRVRQSTSTPGPARFRCVALDPMFHETTLFLSFVDTPAGVSTNDKKSVVSWNIGSSATHLNLAGPGVDVDCLTLVDDLCKSMEDYALVLDHDTEPAAIGSNTKLVVDPRSPCERWTRAFWARLRAVG